MSACCRTTTSRLRRLHSHLQAPSYQHHLVFFLISIHHQQPPQQREEDSQHSLRLHSAYPQRPNLPIRHPDRIPDRRLPTMSAATANPHTSSPPAEPKKKEPLATAAPVKEKKTEEDDDDSDSDSDDPDGKGKEAGAKGKEHDASAKPHSSAKKHAKDPSGKPKADAGECSIDRKLNIAGADQLRRKAPSQGWQERTQTSRCCQCWRPQHSR